MRYNGLKNMIGGRPLDTTSRILNEYHDYQTKIGSRVALYRAVAHAFGVVSALYPGSHVDIAPSLVIPKVTYVDSYRGTIQFFRHLNEIQSFIEQEKEYPGTCELSFIGAAYENELKIDPVDLIISQYAGFAGQATKRYLKTGGILLSNDSHADATLAKFDEAFELIGVIDEDNQLSSTHLEGFFQLSKGREVDLANVRKTMKGPKYTRMAENYLFRKR